MVCTRIDNRPDVSSAGFWRDDRGAAMGEYGMLIALISLALVTTIVSFRGSLFSSYNESQTEVHEIIDEGMYGSEPGIDVP